MLLPLFLLLTASGIPVTVDRLSLGARMHRFSHSRIAAATASSLHARGLIVGTIPSLSDVAADGIVTKSWSFASAHPRRVEAADVDLSFWASQKKKGPFGVVVGMPLLEMSDAARTVCQVTLGGGLVAGTDGAALGKASKGLVLDISCLKPGSAVIAIHLPLTRDDTGAALVPVVIKFEKFCANKAVRALEVAAKFQDSLRNQSASVMALGAALPGWRRPAAGAAAARPLVRLSSHDLGLLTFRAQTPMRADEAPSDVVFLPAQAEVTPPSVALATLGGELATAATMAPGASKKLWIAMDCVAEGDATVDVTLTPDPPFEPFASTTFSFVYACGGPAAKLLVATDGTGCAMRRKAEITADGDKPLADVAKGGVLLPGVGSRLSGNATRPVASPREFFYALLPRTPDEVTHGLPKSVAMTIGATTLSWPLADVEAVGDTGVAGAASPATSEGWSSVKLRHRCAPPSSASASGSGKGEAEAAVRRAKSSAMRSPEGLLVDTILRISPTGHNALDLPLRLRCGGSRPGANAHVPADAIHPGASGHVELLRDGRPQNAVVITARTAPLVVHLLGGATQRVKQASVAAAAVATSTKDGASSPPVGLPMLHTAVVRERTSAAFNDGGELSPNAKADLTVRHDCPASGYFPAVVGRGAHGMTYKVTTTVELVDPPHAPLALEWTVHCRGWLQMPGYVALAVVVLLLLLVAAVFVLRWVAQRMCGKGGGSKQDVAPDDMSLPLNS